MFFNEWLPWLKRVCGPTPGGRRRSPPARRRPRLALEALETRLAPATLNLVGGTLTFTLDVGAAAVMSGTATALTFDSGPGHSIHSNAAAQAIGFNTGAQTSGPGSLATVTTIDVVGGGQGEALTLNGGSAAETIGVSASQVTRSDGRPVSYSGLASLTVNGTDQADTINVTSTASGTATTVNGGGGDTYVVTQNAVAAAGLSLNGTGGTNTLTVISTATGPETIGVTGTQVTRSNSGTVTFSGMTSLTVTGTDNADAFDVTPSATLPITIDGKAPTTAPGDSLNYSGSAGQINAIDANDGTITQAGFQPITYKSIETLTGNASLVLVLDAGAQANDGTPDAFLIRGNGSAFEAYVNGSLAYTSQTAYFHSIIVNGSGDDDTLTVDASNGNPIPKSGIAFNGGGGTNTLNILGGSFTTDTYNYTSAHDGNIHLDSQVITYTNLTPLTNTGTAANSVFNLPAGTVGASLQDDGTLGNNTVQLASTNATFETTTFTVPTNSLAVNAGGGTDTITTAANFSGDFNAALTINGTAATDTVSLNALTLGNAGANPGSLSVTAKTIDLNGGINTSAGTAGSVTLTGGIRLGTDVTINTGTSGDVTVSGTVDGTLDAGNNPIASLTIVAGAGNVTLGSVGQATELGTLTVSTTGTTTLNGNITTDSNGATESGDIDFRFATGGIVLGSSVTLNADANGDGTSGTVDLGGSAVNATSAGAQGLTLIAGNGGGFNDVITLPTIGNTAALQFLTIERTSNSGDALLTGNVSTDDTIGTGDVTVQAMAPATAPVTVVLGHDVTINTDAGGSGTGGAVDLSQAAVDPSIPGAQSLTIATGNGAVTLGAIGHAQELGGLRVTTTGPTTLNGDITIGNSVEAGDINLSAARGGITLGNTITINPDAHLNGTSGVVDLTGSAIEATAAGVQGLLIFPGDGNGATDALILRTVGDTAPLGFLLVEPTSSTGTTLLDGNISTDNTHNSGEVGIFPGGFNAPAVVPVVLGHDVTINTAAAGGSGGLIELAGATIDASTATAQSLTTTTGSSFVALGTIGGTTPLGGLRVLTTSGQAFLDGNITTDSGVEPGNIDLSAATGSITLGNTITINSDANGDGSSGVVDLSGSVVGAATAGVQGLTVISGDGNRAADSLILPAVGVNLPLAFLTIELTSNAGRALLNGYIGTDNSIASGAVTVTATGAAVAPVAVVLGNDVTINTAANGGSGGLVDLSQATVDAGTATTQSLAIGAGSGAVTLGAIGGGSALGGLSVTTTGLTTLDGDVTTDSGVEPGNIDLSLATGGVVLDRTVTLNADANGDGTSGAVSLGGSALDATSAGAQGLAIQAPGNSVQAADLGTHIALAFLTIDLAGSIADTGSIDAAGAVQFVAQQDIAVDNVSGASVSLTGGAAGTGAVLSINGQVTGSPVSVSGGAGDDTFDLNPVGGSSALTVNGGAGSDRFNVTPAGSVAFTIHGDDPTPPANPGDTLNVNLAGTTNPNLSLVQPTPSDGFKGTWTFDNAGPIAFDTIETLLPAAADLAVTLTASPAAPVEGGAITYTLSVTNKGPLPATGVTLTDLVPATTRFVRFTSSSFTGYNPANGQATLANLPANQSATATLVIRATEEGSVTDTASVGSSVPDLNPADNTASLTLTVADVRVNAVGQNIQELEGLSTGTATVATFTDPAGAEATSDYAAVVLWGDGTSSSGAAVSIVPAGVGVFLVQSSHTYAGEGTFQIQTGILHGSVTGTDKASATSTAHVTDNIGILLLDVSGRPALTLSGAGKVTVSGGGGAIVINSPASVSAVDSGSGSVSAAEMDVGGSPGVQATGTGTFPSDLTTHAAATLDPFAALVPPSPGPSSGGVNFASGSHTLSPGTYSGPIAGSGTASVTLLPGVYYLEGGLTVSNFGQVSGSGVLLYNAPSGSGGGITLTDGGRVSLSAPTSGPFAGLVLWQARGSSVPLTVGVKGNLRLTGSLYAPSAVVSVGGNAAVLALQGSPSGGFGAHLVAADLQVSSNGVVTVDASNNADPPATGSAGPHAAAASPRGAAAPAVASGGAAGRPAVNPLTAYLSQLSGQGLAGVEAALTARSVSVNAIASGGSSSGTPTGTPPTSGSAGLSTVTSTGGGFSSGGSTAGKGKPSGSALADSLLDTLFALVFDGNQPGGS
jgi:hypothetical protein